MKDYQYKSLTETIEKLKEENQNLRNISEKLSLALASAEDRIDKGIEYINPRFSLQGDFTYYEWNDLLTDILSILRGEKR